VTDFPKILTDPWVIPDSLDDISSMFAPNVLAYIGYIVNETDLHRQEGVAHILDHFCVSWRGNNSITFDSAVELSNVWKQITDSKRQPFATAFAILPTQNPECATKHGAC